MDHSSVLPLVVAWGAQARGGHGELAMKRLVQMAAIAFAFSLILSAFLTPRAEAAGDFWTTKQPMPTARAYLGVAVVYDKIYAIGGSGYLRTNEEYDPATNTWTTKKPMPTGRMNFAIAVCQNKIYVMGGQNGYLSITGVNEVYDPVTDTWETKASMPTPRHGLQANVVNGKIYLIGGIKDPYTGEVSNLNEVYDPATDTWTTKAPAPYATYGYASAVVDNKIYIIGFKTQIYDPETDTWSFGTPPPNYGGLAAAAATTGVWAPKRIYYIIPVLDEYHFRYESNINQVYNPEDDSWSVGASMPTSRSGFAMAVVKDRLYAIGGDRYPLLMPQEFYAVNEEYTPIGYGTMPPTISIVSPETKTYTTNNIPLTFTVNKPVSWMGYSLDGQANVTITGNTTLTGLPDGSHSLIVFAMDTSGNTGASETIYFSIKTQQSESFPHVWVVAAAAVTATSAAALIVCFTKIKKTTRKNKQTKTPSTNNKHIHNHPH